MGIMLWLIWLALFVQQNQGNYPDYTSLTVSTTDQC